MGRLRDPGHDRFNPSSGIKAIQTAKELAAKFTTSALDCQDFTCFSTGFSLFCHLPASFSPSALRCERLASGANSVSTYGRKSQKSRFFSIYGSERPRLSGFHCASRKLFCHHRPPSDGLESPSDRGLLSTVRSLFIVHRPSRRCRPSSPFVYSLTVTPTVYRPTAVCRLRSDGLESPSYSGLPSVVPIRLFVPLFVDGHPHRPSSNCRPPSDGLESPSYSGLPSAIPIRLFVPHSLTVTPTVHRPTAVCRLPSAVY